MHRMFDGKENFNDGGYLTIGFAGRQPNIADWYTNNGSLYLTSLAFLPLGLPATHSFWSDAEQPWTSQKAWGGKHSDSVTRRRDHAKSVRALPALIGDNKKRSLDVIFL